MSFLLSLWTLPILLLGMLMVGVNIFRFLRHHPRFGQSNRKDAIRDAVVVVLVLAAFLAAPQFLVATSVVLRTVFWVLYAGFIGTGIRYLVKWGSLIVNKEEQEGEVPPPADHGDDHDCGCGKK